MKLTLIHTAILGILAVLPISSSPANAAQQGGCSWKLLPFEADVCALGSQSGGHGKPSAPGRTDYAPPYRPPVVDPGNGGTDDGCDNSGALGSSKESKGRSTSGYTGGKSARN